MQQFAASYASTGSRDDALMSSMFNQPRRIDRSTRLQSGRVSRIDTISLVRPTTVTQMSTTHVVSPAGSSSSQRPILKPANSTRPPTQSNLERCELSPPDLDA